MALSSHGCPTRPHSVSSQRLALASPTSTLKTSFAGVPGALRKSAQVSLARACAAPRSPRHIRCEAVAAPSSKVAEVDIHTYDAAIAAAGDKLVVLDMYTQWCGPCKLIAPKIEALTQSFSSAVFLKLDCNEENKPLAKSLGVRSVPTFKLIRRGEIVAEVVGAKYDKLVDAIVLNLWEVDGEQDAARKLLQPGKVVEVNKDTFYPALREAGSKLVVLDMYTVWCGPCKLIAPKLEELASSNADLVILKLDCNEENKPLAKGLGIVSVPTLKLFKSYEFLDEVKGAKWELLLEKIQAHR